MTTIAVLDLDGAILKSSLIKYQAMLSLLRPTLTSVRPSANPFWHGAAFPRRDKLAGILHEIVGIEPDTELIANYLTR